jgi:glycosyltransferase involved in cell wall biosynthesis
VRVAIIAPPYLPIPPEKYGGIEQIVYHLIRGLKEAGHEPILFGPGDSKVDCKIIPIVEKALHIPDTKAGLPKHLDEVRESEKATHKALQKLLPKIDIIHSHGFDLTAFKDYPNVTTLHNKVGFPELETLMLQKDLNFVSISKNQQELCPDLKYIGVVYNGEDPDDFPLVTKPEDYLCFLGRFDRDKNPHLAIQLALSVGMKIKLAGKIDHDSEGYFEEEIEKYFEHPLVEYQGELGLVAKVKLLSQAKCNLHPINFREPFGLTVLEAAYCGTPTLAVDRGSMSELIEQDRTGLLVEDFLEGRHQVKECFKMDRGYIASRARQLFNYQGMTAGYIEAYQQVISSSKK